MAREITHTENCAGRWSFREDDVRGSLRTVDCRGECHHVQTRNALDLVEPSAAALARAEFELPEGAVGRYRLAVSVITYVDIDVLGGVDEAEYMAKQLIPLMASNDWKQSIPRLYPEITCLVPTGMIDRPVLVGPGIGDDIEAGVQREREAAEKKARDERLSRELGSHY